MVDLLPYLSQHHGRKPVLTHSLVLYLVNSAIVSAGTDFDFPGDACYLNDQGRKKFLRAFLQRMEEPLATPDGEQPRWDLLNRQVKAYRQFVSDPSLGYKPYLIR